MSNIHQDGENLPKKVNTEAGNGPMQNNDAKQKEATVTVAEPEAKGKPQEVTKVWVKK